MQPATGASTAALSPMPATPPGVPYDPGSSSPTAGEPAPHAFPVMEMPAPVPAPAIGIPWPAGGMLAAARLGRLGSAGRSDPVLPAAPSPPSEGDSSGFSPFALTSEISRALQPLARCDFDGLPGADVFVGGDGGVGKDARGDVDSRADFAGGPMSENAAQFAPEVVRDRDAADSAFRPLLSGPAGGCDPSPVTGSEPSTCVQSQGVQLNTSENLEDAMMGTPQGAAPEKATPVVSISSRASTVEAPVAMNAPMDTCEREITGRARTEEVFEKAGSERPAKGKGSRAGVQWLRGDLRRLDAAIVSVTRAKVRSSSPHSLSICGDDFEAVASKAGMDVARCRRRIYNRNLVLRRWFVQQGTIGIAAAKTKVGHGSVARSHGPQHQLPWHETEISRLDSALEELCPQLGSTRVGEERGVAEMQNGTFGKIVNTVNSRSAEHVLFELQRSRGWSTTLSPPPIPERVGDVATDAVDADEVITRRSGAVADPVSTEGGDDAVEARARQASPEVVHAGISSPVTPGDSTRNSQKRKRCRPWYQGELERLDRGLALYKPGSIGRKSRNWPAIAALVRTRSATQCRRRVMYIREKSRLTVKTETCAKAEATLEPPLDSPVSAVPSPRESEPGSGDRLPKKLGLQPELVPRKGFAHQIGGLPIAIRDDSDVEEVENDIGNDVVVSGNGQVVVCLRPSCPLPAVLPMSQFRAEREAKRHAVDMGHLRAGSDGYGFASRDATRQAILSATPPNTENI